MIQKPTYEELEQRVRELERAELERQRKEMALQAQVLHYSTLMDGSLDGIAIIDQEHRVREANKRFAEMLRYTPEEVLSLHTWDWEAVMNEAKIRLNFADLSKTKTIFETQHRRKDGTIYDAEVTACGVKLGDESMILTTTRDITERKQAEKALRASERFLQNIFDGIQDGISVLDRGLNIIRCNFRMEDWYAQNLPLVGKKCYRVYQGLESPCPWCPSIRAMRTGEVQSEVVPYPSAEKPRGWIALSSFPLKDENGSVIGVIENVKDITVKKQAEEALRESEEKLRITNRIASIFLTKTDEEMYQEILNLVLDKLKSRFGVFGYIDDKGSLVCPSMTRAIWDQCQMKDKDIVFPEDTWGDSIWANGLRTRASAYANRLFKVPEGHIPIERCLTVPLVFQNRSIGLLTVANKDTDYDESDRETLEAIAEYVAPVLEGVLVKRTIEKSLQESEERYRILVEESPLGVSLIGKEGRYRYLNRKFIEIFGYTLEEIPTGKEWFRKAYPDEKYRKEVLAAWMDDQKRYGIGEGRSRTYQVICKDGSRKVIHFRTVTMESGDQMVIYEDVTETHRLEEQLRRAQKMEALGLLAGGVAHDLNNILSGIVSYPELILMDLPEGSPLRKPMKTIHDSGMRAAGVVSDLLTIARGVATGKEALNLNTIINEYMDSAEFENLAKPSTFVHFRSELDPHLLNMRGSPIHLKKSLMNLVTNASEAIEGQGTVTISTFNRYLDEPLKGYDVVRTGEYVVLSVSDNGRGISGKDMERIFEPFYTKKVMGRSGTGLGLAVVWNTVQDHNGYINVKRGEAGTRFELYFPVIREEIGEKTKPTAVQEYMGHGENILVVDDEESQREIASGILTKLGYHADVVSSGEEAIEYVKEHPVDLIVLDMVMPKGMNGRETYKEIINVRPGQKAIIASGYAQTEEVAAAQELGAGNYIKKPYTLEKIGVAVKEELERLR